MKKAAVVIGTMAGIVCTGCGALSLGTTKVDLTPYMEVKFSGYDSYGSAWVELDSDKFEEDYGDKLKATAKGVKKASEENPYTEFASVSDYAATAENINKMSLSSNIEHTYTSSMSESDNLSNGDTIEVTWYAENSLGAYESIYGAEISVEDMTVTVSGLDEIKTFDAFDGVELSFTGMAPDGTAKIESKGKDSACQDLNYSVSPNEGLSNGDKVTVSISTSSFGSYSSSQNTVSDYFIEKYGKVPAESTKEYTVSGLTSYVSSASEIPEGTLSQMKAQAEDAFSAQTVSKLDSDTQDFLSAEYVGNYFLTLKPGVDDGFWSSYNENEIYLIYKVQVRNHCRMDDGSKSYDKGTTYYWYCRFDNLYLTDSGECSVDLADYRTANSDGKKFEVDSNVPCLAFGNNKTWAHYGYEKLDMLYNQHVTSQIDKYTCEDNIADANIQ